MSVTAAKSSEEESSSSHFFPGGLPQRRISPKRGSEESSRKTHKTWFWGLGPATSQIESEIEVAAQHDVHVVVIGETGTGKEFVAHELHRRRRSRLSTNDIESPFVAVNSGAIPEALAESILFGHERGAFTSARERQYGKFELARRGTLFLDEVQTLPLSTQIKLLRVLQSGELDRLGGKSSGKIECQVVAATNVPLELLVEKKVFRRDLYYRLNICPIYLPALRYRKEDLPVLIRGLLEKIRARYRLSASEVSPDAFDLFLSHTWPGNIRELEHTLLYAAFRTRDVIEPKHLPASLTGVLERYMNSGSWSF